MTYDKATGEVTIHESSESLKRKRVIRKTDDLEQHKKDLLKEQGLEEDGLPNENADIQELKEKMK